MSYLDKLKSEEPLERISAILSITEEPITDSVAGELCDLIIDTDNGVRSTLTQKLKIGNNPIIPSFLVKYISYPDLSVKNLAGEILLELGPISVEAMLSHLDRGDDDDKKFIVDILGLIGDKSAENKIIELLNSNENENVILACIEALGNLKAENAISYFISLYPIIDIFKPTIIEALGKIGSQESLDFVIAKYEEENDDLTKFSIIESLGSIGDERAFFFLLSELNEPNGPFLWPIIKSIYNLKEKFGFDIPFDERTRNIILQTINDANSECKKIAAHLLSVFNDKEILTFYLKVIGNDPETDDIILNKFLENPEIFIGIISEALDQKPDNIIRILEVMKEIVQLKKTELFSYTSPLQLRDISDSLTLYLNDYSEEIRLIVLEILFILDKDTAILFFDDLADDHNLWNRLKLVDMLEEVTNPEVESILQKLLNDPEEMIRDRASKCLSVTKNIIDQTEIRCKI